MYEVKLILQTNKPLMKEDLSFIGTLIKEVTDELDVDRHHLETYVICSECGYEKTRVNPMRANKNEWKCRNCGTIILRSTIKEQPE